MASTLQSPLTPLITHHRNPHLSLSSRNPKPPSIHCGPRDNRGPLVKGRILSTEAIQAVQALKRAQNSPENPTLQKTLTRLLKSDLLATLRELLRQGHHNLALTVFSTVRSEPWYKLDLSLYADLVVALGKEGGKRGEDIDRLIEGLEMEVMNGGDGGMGIDWSDKKGLSRLVKGLIGAEKRESMVRMYGVLKKCWWGCRGSGVVVDEYLGKVLSNGFKRFGEVGLSLEVDLAVDTYLKDCLGRPV